MVRVLYILYASSLVIGLVYLDYRGMTVDHAYYAAHAASARSGHHGAGGGYYYRSGGYNHK